jgi:hypothetical protein
MASRYLQKSRRRKRPPPEPQVTRNAEIVAANNRGVGLMGRFEYEQGYQWYRRAMNLFTQDGEAVGPLPTTGQGSPSRDRLHARYNTRFQDGR